METILIISSVLLWVMILLNLLLTLGLSRRLNARLPRMDFLKIGQPAPSFTAQTLQGETVTLSSYARRAVAFVFTSPHSANRVVRSFPGSKDYTPRLNSLELSWFW